MVSEWQYEDEQMLLCLLRTLGSIFVLLWTQASVILSMDMWYLIHIAT